MLPNDNICVLIIVAIDNRRISILEYFNLFFSHFSHFFQSEVAAFGIVKK